MCHFTLREHLTGAWTESMEGLVFALESDQKLKAGLILHNLHTMCAFFFERDTAPFFRKSLDIEQVMQDQTSLRISDQTLSAELIIFWGKR